MSKETNLYEGVTPFLPDYAFRGLMKYCNGEETGLPEMPEFASTFGNYELNFTSDETNDDKIHVEVCGVTVRGRFKNLNCTEEQLKAMKERADRYFTIRDERLAAEFLQEIQERQEYEDEINRYGMPGALYGKWY